MRAPEQMSFAPPAGAWKAWSADRPPFPAPIERGRHSRRKPVLLLGPALAGLMAFLVWGGLAWAAGGRDWRPTLAVALLAGAIALGFTAVVVAGAVLGEEPEADEGDALAAPGCELLRAICSRGRESQPPSVHGD